MGISRNRWNLKQIWGMSWEGSRRLEMWKQRKRYSCLIASPDIMMLLGTWPYPQGEAWWRKIVSATRPHAPKAESTTALCLSHERCLQGWLSLALTSVASLVDLEQQVGLWQMLEGLVRARLRQWSRPGAVPTAPERSWPPLLMWVGSLGSNWASRYWWAPLDLEVSEVGCGVIVSVLSLLKSCWPECAIVFFVSGLPGPGRSFMAWWTAAAADRTLPSVSHTQGRALSIFSVTLWHTSQP